MEEMLSTAGFQMKRAYTPAKLSHLQTLSQRQLVVHSYNGRRRYVYADAAGCRCLYAGDDADYRRFQQLVLERNIATEKREAVEVNRAASMDWVMWGPWVW